MRLVALALIRFYQACLSPALPSSCRYYPSCSAYAYEAVQKWGAVRGMMMAFGRVLRCRPLAGYGYDPVP
jgi:putative membrane protein insertion efficiency factor